MTSMRAVMKSARMRALPPPLRLTSMKASLAIVKTPFAGAGQDDVKLRGVGVLTADFDCLGAAGLGGLGLGLRLLFFLCLCLGLLLRGHELRQGRLHLLNCG